MRELVVDGYYDDPLLAAADRYWRSAEWQSVRELLPGTPGIALDVGAGRGISSYALAKDDFIVHALEPDASAIVGANAIRRLSTEAGLAISVVENMSEKLPFENAAFDLVFVRAALHHAADIKAACLEFSRVLKPGGTLLAIREHVISHKDHLPSFLESHPLHRLYGGENAYLVSEYLEAFRSAGLSIRRVVRPLDSAINYAPRTAEQVRDEIAKRVGKAPLIAAGVRALLRNSLVWRLCRGLAARFDNRPGRLYSFVLGKP